MRARIESSVALRRAVQASVDACLLALAYTLAYVLRFDSIPQRYQDLLVVSNAEATSEYSLHTTGYAFDVLRRYRSRAQAIAFQFALDRLQALDLVAWVREPAAIHITAASDAVALRP